MSEISVAARIKMARKMAELNTQASLLKKIPQWSASRLGNYEAGISMPGPDDILLIAKATESSPCWLMFGLGPIRANHRDQQAIRHQNLCNLVDKVSEKSGAVVRLIKKLGISRQALDEHIDNPFKPISNELTSHLETYMEVRKGWMNEQHVEHDPLCLSFPEDIRELMALYSGMDKKGRTTALAVMRTLSSAL